MEVHHHPQVEKKNLKEYLLEGLMIFIAVTMGFFAETIRENITEHERAAIFAKAMLKDLTTDTAELISYRNYMTKASVNVDTLLDLLANQDPSKIPSGKLYWYGLWGGANRFFTPNDATFQQMKASGSLRYFTDPQLSEEVAYYDRLCRSNQEHQETDRTLFVEVRKARSKIFLFSYNKEANDIAFDFLFNKELFNSRFSKFIASNPPLLTYDKTVFNEYEEMVRSRFHNNFVQEADTLLVHATSLMNLLQKKYNLSEE